jgi:hypothetical protein
MSLLSVANRFPPCLCRFVARKNHGHTPMSHRDIAAASGISKTKVAELSLRRTWDGVPIDEVESFARACGVDFLRPKRVLEYLRKAKRVHIQNATQAQKEFLQRMFTGRE